MSPAAGTTAMRVLVAVVLAFTLPLAGCLSDAPAAASLPTGEPSPQAEPLHPEGTPEFCLSEADSGLEPPFGPRPCDYWDEDFHEYVLYDLDTPVIDVVILPSAGPDAVDAAASRTSVQAWEDGIRAYAAPWFNASFEMNVYMVGKDVPTLDAVQDPEVVVLSTGARGVLGIGAEPKQMACTVIGGGEARFTYPEHRHGDVLVQAADCTGTGFTCFAINAGSTDTMDLYDLIAHEVGHCLGAGHVGDALDFRARYAPVEDIMSYQSNATQVHCVSTMNVRVLEGVYAHLLDQPEATWLPRDSYYAMSPLDYQQVPCPNP